MRIYLVQHAQAKSKEEDPDRPLSDHGIRDAERLAVFLGDRTEVEVAAIHHSGKNRAEQTAGIFAGKLHPEGGIHAADGLGPLDDPAEWADRLSEEKGDVMLVGHLPHMSRLASHMLLGEPDREILHVQNAGVICLEGQEEAWKLEWMMVPALLGG